MVQQDRRNFVKQQRQQVKSKSKSKQQQQLHLSERRDGLMRLARLPMLLIITAALTTIHCEMLLSESLSSDLVSSSPAGSTTHPAQPKDSPLTLPGSPMASSSSLPSYRQRAFDLNSAMENQQQRSAKEHNNHVVLIGGSKNDDGAAISHQFQQQDLLPSRAVGVDSAARLSSRSSDVNLLHEPAGQDVSTSAVRAEPTTTDRAVNIDDPNEQLPIIIAETNFGSLDQQLKTNLSPAEFDGEQQQQQQEQKQQQQQQLVKNTVVIGGPNAGGGDSIENDGSSKNGGEQLRHHQQQQQQIIERRFGLFKKGQQNNNNNLPYAGLAAIPYSNECERCLSNAGLQSQLGGQPWPLEPPPSLRQPLINPLPNIHQHSSTSGHSFGSFKSKLNKFQIPRPSPLGESYYNYGQPNYHSTLMGTRYRAPGRTLLPYIRAANPSNQQLAFNCMPPPGLTGSQVGPIVGSIGLSNNPSSIEDSRVSQQISYSQY